MNLADIAAERSTVKALLKDNRRRLRVLARIRVQRIRGAMFGHASRK